MPDITRQAASKAWKKLCKNHVVDGAAMAASVAAPASVRHGAETAQPQHQEVFFVNLSYKLSGTYNLVNQVSQKNMFCQKQIK